MYTTFYPVNLIFGLLAPKILPRNKSNVGRTKGQHGPGTGRGNKSNGAAHRRDDHSSSNAVAAQPVPKATSPTKTRLVIDQGPSPLYCSDECQYEALNGDLGALSLDYDPNRESPPQQRNQSNNLGLVHFGPSSQTESESSLSSLESMASTSSSSWVRDTSFEKPDTSSFATIASIYGFPEPPPLPPFIPRDRSGQTFSRSAPSDYQSGIMMAGRRMDEAFTELGTVKPSQHFPSEKNKSEPAKPVPGWTDGSNAWRSSAYSFVSKSGSSDLDDLQHNPYKSFVASSHRSQAAISTLGERIPDVEPRPRKKSLESEELYANYAMFSNKRSSSRTSLQTGTSPQQGADLGPRQRSRRSLVKAGAEGMLLVPNITMKSRSTSSSSLSRFEGPQSLPSNYTIRPRKRSGGLMGLTAITPIETPTRVASPPSSPIKSKSPTKGPLAHLRPSPTSEYI